METVRPRVIPVLLLEDRYLVKTMGFKKPKYIGDPINSVKIFNEKQADELMILDIRASQRHVGIDFSFIEEMAGEAFMPIAYGGGIASFADAERLFRLGVEKIVLNTALVTRPGLVTEIADAYGAQAVVASIDVDRSRLGRQRVVVNQAGRRTAPQLVPEEWARALAADGAGEILLTSVPKEGSRSGYDLELISSVCHAVPVPVIAHGGAGSLADLGAAVRAGASAVAAGSLFVQHGQERAVLITYPADDVLTTALLRKVP
jgi:cyclase